MALAGTLDPLAHLAAARQGAGAVFGGGVEGKNLQDETPEKKGSGKD